MCKKRRPLQKNTGIFSILNKYDQMRILCRFTCGMNILMILTANFLIFFIQFNSEVKVKGHGGIFRYQRLEYGVLYICTKFQPHITTNMEVVLKFSPTTLSLQKCAKSYKKVQKKCDFFSCKNLVLNPHFRKKNSWES